MNWVLNSGTTSFFGWGDYSNHMHVHYWGGLYGKDENNTKLNIRNGYYNIDVVINPSGLDYWTGEINYAFDANLHIYWPGGINQPPIAISNPGVVAVQSQSYEIYVRQVNNDNLDDISFIATFPNEWEFENGNITCVDLE
jgi:hypothetical protein